MTAYWFSSADVVDEAALAEYAKLARPAMERQRHVILEFDSLEAAQACYDSPEYQAALVFAKKAVVRDAVIVEGA